MVTIHTWCHLLWCWWLELNWSLNGIQWPGERTAPAWMNSKYLRIGQTFCSWWSDNLFKLPVIQISIPFSHFLTHIPLKSQYFIVTTSSVVLHRLDYGWCFLAGVVLGEVPYPVTTYLIFNGRSPSKLAFGSLSRLILREIGHAMCSRDSRNKASHPWWLQFSDRTSRLRRWAEIDVKLRPGERKPEPLVPSMAQIYQTQWKQ